MSEASQSGGASPHERPGVGGPSRLPARSVDAAAAGNEGPAPQLSKMPRGRAIALGLLVLELVWLGLIGYGIAEFIRVAFG
jgi:hypothetical protein